MDAKKARSIQMKPKDKIGKITNKYLIKEVYSFTYITR